MESKERVLVVHQDAHAEVFKELTDSLKTSQVTEADFSSCGIGPVALGHLGEWVREARAALNEVNVAFNNIGSEGGIAFLGIQSLHSHLQTAPDFTPTERRWHTGVH